MAQNKPKKVLFLITKATAGGAQRYVGDLMHALPAHGFEVVLAHGKTGRLSETAVQLGLQTVPVPALDRDISLFSDVRSFFQIWNMISTERPDVLHLNSSKAAALGALAGRLLGIPRIVFTAHGWPFNEDRSRTSRRVIYVLSWLTAFLSHKTIVVSRSDEAQGKRMLWVKRKIVYIPIGLGEIRFRPREEAAQSLSLFGQMPRLVTIAELTKNKGLRYGIEAVALLKQKGVDMSYSIIGIGEDRASLESLATQYGIADRVHFLGFVDHAARYLKAFDVFLLPSIKEGMPYVLLEAALACMPIVTTTVVNPDIMHSYTNVRAIEPRKPDLIAEALTEVLTEQKEKQLFRTAPQFPLEDMVAATIQAYA